MRAAPSIARGRYRGGVDSTSAGMAAAVDRGGARRDQAGERWRRTSLALFSLSSGWG